MTNVVECMKKDLKKVEEVINIHEAKKNFNPSTIDIEPQRKNNPNRNVSDIKSTDVLGIEIMTESTGEYFYNSATKPGYPCLGVELKTYLDRDRVKPKRKIRTVFRNTDWFRSSSTVHKINLNLFYNIVTTENPSLMENLAFKNNNDVKKVKEYINTILDRIEIK